MSECCFFCDELEVLEEHHIVPQRFDGSDSDENLVTVCPTCHRKLESIYDARFYDEIGAKSSTDEPAFKSRTYTDHLNYFIAVFSNAAEAGSVQHGEHFTTVDRGVNDTRELRVKLPTAFDQVRRYARDHAEWRIEDLLDSVNDYRARLRDNAEDTMGYVTTTSQPTQLGESMTRCVGLDVERADEQIDEFRGDLFTGEPVQDVKKKNLAKQLFFENRGGQND